MLPAFRYHPDPLRTGSVVAADTECVCCGESRGYVYAIAPIAEEDIEPETLCPCFNVSTAARTCSTSTSRDIESALGLPAQFGQRGQDLLTFGRVLVRPHHRVDRGKA